jgi:hypothetical protein
MKGIPLLKSAPEPDQLADRLDGGDWLGIEIALMPKDVADDDVLARAAEVTRDATDGLVVTAEAPVAWPSGAFVRVDRLDDEARSGIERSAEFAARRLARADDPLVHSSVPGRVPRLRRSMPPLSRSSSASTPGMQ